MASRRLVNTACSKHNLRNRGSCNEQGKLSPYFVAQTEARLGNKREAIRYLIICIHSHDEVVLNLSDNQGFSSLHGEPAFKQLLAKIGLPPVN
jgi:hypothetical protein